MAKYLEQGEVAPDAAARAVREGAARRPSRPGVLRLGAHRRGRRRAARRCSSSSRRIRPKATRRCSTRARAMPRPSSAPSPIPKKHVLAHVFKVVMDPFVGKLGIFRVHQGTVTTRHAALRRRRPQAVQGRAPVHAAGRQERRGRPRGAGRHRRGREGRRDRVRLRAARLARRGPHPHAAARVPDADARRRDHAEEARRRAADLRRAAPDDRRGPDARRRARSDVNETVLRGAGRPAPALGARADGEPVQARGRHAAAAHPLSRDDHRARPRATIGTRSRPAAPASSARCTCASSRCRAAAASSSSTTVKGGVIPTSVHARRCRRASSRCSTTGAIAGFPLQDVRVIVYDGKHHPGRLEGSRVRLRRQEGVPRRDREGAARSCSSRSSASRSSARRSNMGDITGDLSSRRGQVTGTRRLQAGRARGHRARAARRARRLCRAAEVDDRRARRVVDGAVALRAGAAEPAAAARRASTRSRAKHEEESKSDRKRRPWCVTDSARLASTQRTRAR